MKYILFFIAVILFLIVSIPGLIISLIVAFWHSHIGHGFKYEGNKLYKMAFSFDQFANALYPEMWDMLMITNGATHRFGRISETLSYVMGKNQMAGTLSGFGICIKNILKYLTGKEHCLIAVEEFEAGEDKF